jgi:hypothetical protein
MEARNRVGIGFSYQPARLHRLAELIPWNRFLGSLKFYNSGSEAVYVAGSNVEQSLVYPVNQALLNISTQYMPGFDSTVLT